MAKRSAIKRARQAQARRLRNVAVKSAMRTAIRNFREANASGNIDQAKLALQRAIRMVDKAATKGAIHRNQASRRKSRLQRLFNSTQAAAAAKEEQSA